MADSIIEYESPKGEWFTLHGKGDGDRGVMLDESPEGLYEEPTEAIWNSHAFQIGADFGGIRINKRDVDFGVHVVATEGRTWQENYSDWVRSWSFKKCGNLWLDTGVTRRRLPVQLSSEPVLAPDVDPLGVEYGRVAMHATAGYPRWIEDDFISKWVSPQDTLNGSTVTGYVEVSNPTDTECWLKWELQAYPGAKYTLPDFSFGDDRHERAETDAAKLIQLPPLEAGEHLSIDTNESAKDGQFNSSTDTQFYIRMKGKSFCYPIPPDTPKTRLPVAVSGAPAGVGLRVRCPREWSSSLVLPWQ